MTKKKKTTKKPAPPQGAKCAFVRSLPTSLSAAEVQDRAAKKGLVMSRAYIHNIRSAFAKQSRAVLKKSKPVKGTKAQKERLFMNLVIDLGPLRAKALLTRAELAMIPPRAPRKRN